MSTSAPTPPPAPDPYKAAGAQTGQNVQSAIASTMLGNVDQVGPQGSTTYRQGDSFALTGPDGQVYQIPRFIQETRLAPEQQRLYDQQAQLGTRLNDAALRRAETLANDGGPPLDASSLPGVDADFGAARTRVEQAMFDRLNPQLDRDRNALENRLVNEGFQRGTEGFNAGMDQFNRQLSDQRLAITAQGLNEQRTLNDMQQGNRQRALQEMLALRNQPISEITALMGGGQAQLPTPQAFRGDDVPAADIAGSIYNTAGLQQKQYEQQLNRYNQGLAGLYGLGQAAVLGGLKKWGGGLM